MSDDYLIRFVIDVGKYLNVQTPYSTTIIHYDDIDECVEDIKYCLTYELSKKGEKNEKKKNEQT